MFVQQAKVKDLQAPRLNSLYFYLSSYCNLNCSHCWIAPTYLNKDEAPEEAPFSLLKETIDQALPLGLSNIKITGGEPFLSRNVFKLISYAYEKKLGIIIETNGTLINDDTACFLKEKAIKHIAVSLDGHNQEVHETIRGQKGCFDRAIEGIKLLKKYNLNVQAIMALYKGNVDYLEDTVNLAERLEVNSFKINCISDISRGGLLRKKRMTLSVSDSIALNKRIDEAIQPRHKIKIILDIPPVFKTLKYIKEQRSTCGIKGILGVLASGQISICGIGEILSSLVLGDIRKESLKDIWENNPILKSIRKGLPGKLEGICATCVFKAYCLGKCRAEAYYDTGNLFSGFSFCEEAAQEGFFPPGRIFRTKQEVAI